MGNIEEDHKGQFQGGRGGVHEAETPHIHVQEIKRGEGEWVLNHSTESKYESFIL